MGTSRVVLGVDFGSTTAKAVLADERGDLLGRASIPQVVQRGPGGAAEQDPDAWWADLRVLVRSAIADAAAGTDVEIAGVAISGHLPTLLLTDVRGRPTAPAMLYADRRADAFIERASELSGQRLSGDEILPKLLWLAESEPRRLRSARRLFNLHDYLGWRLTGERGLDHRTAMRSGLFDPVEMDWRWDLAELVGLDRGALSSVRRGGEVLGTVQPSVAEELGIPAGTLVVVGLGDTPAELIGAGVVAAGDALLYYGTTTTLDVLTHDYAAYLSDPTPIRDWAPYREVGYAVLGPAIRWAAAGFAPDSASADLAALDAEGAALPPDDDAPFVIPAFDAHASGPGHTPSAIVGLQPRHGRADLHRAMLESFGFIARAGLEASGLAPTTSRFVAAGGGAGSAFWRELVSDTLGAPQTWSPRSDAALGMAMLAARAAFGTDVFGAGLTDWLGDVQMTPVDPARREVEDRRYRTWLAIRSTLAGTGASGSH